MKNRKHSDFCNCTIFSVAKYQLNTSIVSPKERILIGEWSSTGLQLHVQAMTKMNTCGILYGLSHVDKIEIQSDRAAKIYMQQLVRLTYSQ